LNGIPMKLMDALRAPAPLPSPAITHTLAQQSFVATENTHEASSETESETGQNREERAKGKGKGRAIKKETGGGQPACARHISV